MISRLTRGYQFLTLLPAATHLCAVKQGSLRPSKEASSMLRVQSLPRWYSLVHVWLLVWITAVPLFHIHLPDNTDRWSLLQSGGAHTVLTPDLPGEYAPPSHDSHRDSSTHIATRAVNSPELGFIVLGDQAKKWEAFALLDSLSHFRAPPPLNRITLVFTLSRAPPHSVRA